MKKIKITESQLKNIKQTMNENLDMPEDDDMKISVIMAVFSHLSDIQEMVGDPKVRDRINFIKKLVRKYPNMDYKVSTSELDSIYDSMLSKPKSDIKPTEDEYKIDDNPFPDGYDFSMNESVSKIKNEFKRFIK
jgi:hypothetical protein